MIAVETSIREPIVRTEDVFMDFTARGALRGSRRVVHAVRGVTLEIEPGEVVGLVGESGSGKSTLGRLVLALLRPTRGRVLVEEADVAKLTQRQLTGLRRNLQVIFQDPFTSLNPLMTVQQILVEPLKIHSLPRAGWRTRVNELLDLVGLEQSALLRKPAEFSGGQQQRIAIARALALNPALIVADEAVSALDVSIQAQILNLFMDVQRELGMSYLFISHNLGVVRHISHRVAVMYLGEIVETARAEQLYATPKHPYTQALLSALPIPDPVLERRRERIVLPGDPPSPTDVPAGCPLHTRCPIAVDRCAVEHPELRPVAGGDHLAACHLAD